MMRDALKICTLLVAIFVLFTATGIELLNVRAGGMLPRKEYRNGDPNDGLTKWRDAFCTNEQMWRISHSPEIPEDRPLTAAEKTVMNRDIEDARARNDLKGLVSSSGQLQYLMVPLLIVLSMMLMLRIPHSAKQIAFGAVPLLIGVVGGILMFSRAYFTSLGW